MRHVMQEMLRYVWAALVAFLAAGPVYPVLHVVQRPVRTPTSPNVLPRF